MSDDSTLYISGFDGTLTAIDIMGDVDEDGISDAWEVRFGLDPNDPADAQLDSDADGLDGLGEFQNNTNPNIADTDLDGLSDGDEILVHNTDPLSTDTDNDGLLDGDEVLVWLTDPRLADTDSDGLNDWEEINSYGTNPLSSDTDSDGFSDYEELLTGSDPLVDLSVPAPMGTIEQSFEAGTLPLGWQQVGSDDGDWSVEAGGASDGTYRLTSGPLQDNESAWITFTGFFGNGSVSFDTEVGAPWCCDRLYVYLDDQFLFYVNAGTGDWQTHSFDVTSGIHRVSFEYRRDHRPNGFDASASIDLFRHTQDNDHDGLSDEWEVLYGLNPNDAADAFTDPDSDGLDNVGEYAAETSPTNSDSDSDGMPDGWEVTYLLDPTVDDAPFDNDSDGLSNADEYVAGTLPNRLDTDNDGMPDGWEVSFSLNPLAVDNLDDTDTDGLANGTEYTLGTLPNNNDSDGDLMPDGWEVDNNLNPLVDDASGDPDGDGATNLDEYTVGTDPQAAPPPPPPPPSPPSQSGGGGSMSILFLMVLCRCAMASRRSRIQIQSLAASRLP